MRIAVTGATGSLGGALIAVLAQRSDVRRVVAISRDEVKSGDLADRWADFPALRCQLGDVRDRDRMTELFRGCDIVIHAAALKRITHSAYSPEEVVKTNVGGTINVIQAATEAGVGRVVFVSSDKACIAWGSPIAMSDGPNVPIGMIVGHRLKLPVATYDGGALRTGAIENWYANPLGGRRLYRLSYEGARRQGRFETGVTLTSDHRVLTVDGWKAVEDLGADDRLITAEPAPNGKQLALLAGTLLGDSTIRAKISRPNMRMGHSGSQREWLEAKVRGLRGFDAEITSSCHRGDRKSEFFVWDSACSVYWRELRSVFYPDGGPKAIPRVLFTRLLAAAPAILLAAWYQDDGCLGSSWRTKAGEHRGTARLATHCFSEDDVQWVAAELGRMGLKAEARRLNGSTQPGAVKEFYWELRFDWKATKELFRLIGPGVVPCLRHKVLDDTPAYDPEFWDLGASERYTARPVVAPVADAPATVYCLDVADTHNFVVCGIILHNCSATNLYGSTKFTAECFAVQSNSYSVPRGTRVAAVRYGNVMGSRGSVVHVWRDILARGKPLSITDTRMTRFLITLPAAVDFVLGAVKDMVGGEVFVPRLPAARILDLAEAVERAFGAAHGREGVGLRPGGEKLHEALLSQEEPERTWLESTHRMVVLPSHHSWCGPERWGVTTPRLIAPYTSDAPDRWLTVDELTTMVREAWTYAPR